jgi:hypothetical protein
MLDDVRTVRRILDEGNRAQTFRFPGLDAARARLVSPSPRLDRCMRTDDATLLAVDHGEWGGGVEVMDRLGKRQVFDGNARALVKSSAGLIAVGGEAHMAPGWGFLGEVRFDERGARVASLACLPSQPEAIAVDDDGTLLVVLTVRPTSPDRQSGAPREMTIAVDDDGTLYDLACDTGRASQRLAIAWDTAQDAHGCMELAWGVRVPRF